MEKVITIYGKEYKKEGRSFIAYTYTKNGEKYYRVKFTKNCLRPQIKGYVNLVIDDECVSIQRAKSGEEKLGDILWIRKTIDSYENEEKNRQSKEKLRKEIEELF